MSIDFTNLDYLKNGSEIQKKIYKLLDENLTFRILKDYKPILVGTFPIDINIDSSDLDVILETQNVEDLYEFLIQNFGKQKSFRIKILDYSKQNLVCNFTLDDFEIEIYSENKPTFLQNGYLHMIKEFEILKNHPISLKNKIIQLKKEGYKTEPAFAKALNLTGDPYIEILKYKTKASDL